jgi:hypothetical protein
MERLVFHAQCVARHLFSTCGDGMGLVALSSVTMPPHTSDAGGNAAGARRVQSDVSAAAGVNWSLG